MSLSATLLDMTLTQFIAEANADRKKPRTQAEWAAFFGISRSYLAEILSGAKEPGRNAIRKIELATQGKVPAAVWFTNDEAA